ncbi:MAG TPA: hypothetical protein VGJ90_04770 [Methylophilaceae bacterium]
MLLWMVVITLSIWALAIFYWKVTYHNPSNSDVVSFLIVAPLALLLFVFVVNSASSYMLRPKVGSSVVAEIEERGGKVKLESEVATSRDWVLSAAFGQLVTLHGESVADLAAAMTKKETKFALDSELMDTEGFPLMSARITDLDIAGTFDAFSEWMGEQKLVDESVVNWLVEDKRTIHLAYTVFSALIRTLLSQDHVAELLANHLNDHKNTLPNIYLVNSVPEHWSPKQKALLSSWLSDEISRQGWPEACVLSIPLMLEGLNAWEILDGINVQIHQSDKLGIYVVTSAQSYLGERTFAEYEANGKLLTNQNKNGSVYGEASAGLLVIDDRLAVNFEGNTVVQLHRAAMLRRDKSADATGKIGPDLLLDVIKDALAVSAVDAAAIKVVAADTDARVSRVTEFFSAINMALPEVDAEQGCLKLQERCGMVGVAAGLASLVYAMDKVATDQTPALWVSNTDSFNRCALVVSPYNNKANSL